MKKTHTTLVLVFTAALGAAFFNPAKAQTYAHQVERIMEDDDWIKSGRENDDRQAYLAEGQSSTTWYRTFSEDYEYAIVAFSEDGDVLDVDLELRTSDGVLYQKDTDSDERAVVIFSPAFTRSLGIKITNYSSLDDENRSKCRFLIFYRKL